MARESEFGADRTTGGRGRGGGDLLEPAPQTTRPKMPSRADGTLKAAARGANCVAKSMLQEAVGSESPPTAAAAAEESGRSLFSLPAWLVVLTSPPPLPPSELRRNAGECRLEEEAGPG